LEYKNRKTTRLKNYNYSQQGMYFVTVCAKDREELFGKIINRKMILSELGKIVLRNLQVIPNYFENVFFDENIIMPNHVHLIIEIIEKNVGADLVSAQNRIQDCGQTQGLSLRNLNRNAGLLSRTIQILKSKSSVEYIRFIKSKNKSCITKIWQRSFYDHIIRNKKELEKIREYILKNPANWEQDKNNIESMPA